MLIGQSPFSGCDEDELFWSICNEVPWIPAYLSKEAANIVKAVRRRLSLELNFNGNKLVYTRNCSSWRKMRVYDWGP